MGLFCTFSFHGSKTITTGEGGMFVTNNSEIYEKVLTLSNHGRSREQQKQFWSDVVGFKYKLSNIQAAIGCAQMERIEELINRKRNILKLYKKNLEIIDGITMNPEPKETINGSWMPTIIFDKQLGVTREKIKDALNNENIDARVFFWPLSSLPMFQSIKENINSISICERAINLPSYFDIQDEQIERICEIVKLQI
jgi:perosamine synthetase